MYLQVCTFTQWIYTRYNNCNSSCCVSSVKQDRQSPQARAFSHKINFNFHIFIRSIQTVPSWTCRSRVRCRETLRWLTENSNVSYCLYTHIFLLYSYVTVCMFFVHACACMCNHNIQIIWKPRWLATRMKRSAFWLAGQGWTWPHCECVLCLCALLSQGNKHRVQWAAHHVQHLILTLTAHQLTYIPLITHSGLVTVYTEPPHT